MNDRTSEKQSLINRIKEQASLLTVETSAEEAMEDLDNLAQTIEDLRRLVGDDLVDEHGDSKEQ